jgi:hypothetical protein
MPHPADKIFTIADREFFFVRASDVQRDGLGLELWEVQNGSDSWIAEVFRNDRKRAIEFSSNAKDIPFTAILRLFAHFEEAVGREFQA